MTLLKTDRTPVEMVDVAIGPVTVKVQGVDVSFDVFNDCKAKKTSGNMPPGFFIKVGRKEGMRYYNIIL
ncbi:uncharacterized protein PpBr36_09904 [Pyricularia pennisetigena]|uniref:uncharacterized protein n=1 Tax=Pyricularia pennisetigena TaxID=1578925 RepID=UPI00114F93D9|nr:uncharacterized protein PpBr36_09904 [Pyricularia pennisetigena]TLS22467.1 hypothetical protein PpBr36_09904 [Pyricularia pennisetigena]